MTSIEDFSEDQSLEIGTTPISAYRLVAGEYIVRLAKEEGFSRVRFIVQLEPDQAVQVSRSLLEATAIPTFGLISYSLTTSPLPRRTL